MTLQELWLLQKANAERLDANDEELRAYLGVSKAALDTYTPEKSVSKVGSRHWSYTTMQGNGHPSVYPTKREAIEAATRHKALKQEQFDNPSGFADIISARASRRLALIEKYQREGMGEMDAGARARKEIPDPENFKRY